MKIIAIDESGDPGYKIESGSCKYFALAFSVFKNEEQLKSLDSALNSLSLKLFKYKDHEFHFSHEKFKFRREFFEVISGIDFFSYVFLIEKSKHKYIKDFYSYVFEYIFINYKKELSDSYFKIDGGDSKRFKREQSTEINRLAKLNNFKINKIRFYNSKNNRDIQVSDFFAGAVRRYLEDKDPNDIELFNIFKNKVKVVLL